MKVSLTFLIILSTISFANANQTRYLCSGDTNELYVMFDAEKNIVITDNAKPIRYWNEPNYRFWHKTQDYTLLEYTFRVSYNKLSGKLEVKSHNLVSSENQWYNYECKVN